MILRPWRAARRLNVENNALALKLLRAGERYSELWEDHLARCDCHDSWDQCPCAEVGGCKGCTSCCRWCHR